MTTPVSITVDLKHAKALKEAGWPQESHFDWLRVRALSLTSQGGGFGEWSDWQLTWENYTKTWMEGCYEIFAAPTASEILAKLPKQILHRNGERELFIIIQFVPNCWVISYEPFGYHHGYIGSIQRADDPSVNSPSLANAAADMYVFLSNNKLLP